jgi:hypothetical protein
MATPPDTFTPTPAHVENPVEFATLLSHDEERIDAYHDGEPLRYRTMENLLGDQPVSGLATHDLEAQLHLVCDESLGPSQRPRDTRHDVLRCSRRWTQLRRTASESLLISLVVTA